MSTNIVYNGVTYTIPATDDVAWGDAVSNFLIAIPDGMLTKVGGAWALTGSDLDLGAAYGISAIYLKTKTATPALAGVLRLAFADAVAWRSEANDKDLVLKPNSANFLTWDAIVLCDISSAQVLTNKAINAPDNTIQEIKDVNISATAAIDVSKINITAASIPWTAVDTVGNIKDADVAADAAIVGSKIVPDFGAQEVKSETGFSVGTTFKTTIKGDPSEDYDLILPDADGISGQALVMSALGHLEWASVPGLALTQHNILVGDSSNLPVPINTNTTGDIKADETTALTIKALAITNAMISASAAIAFSKMAALTASRALVSDGSGVVSVATTTAAEIGYVNGVTSAIQTQLTARVVGPASAVDSNFAAFDTITGKLLKDSGSKAADFATAASVAPLTAAVTATTEPTGFEDCANVVVAYNSGAQTITLTHSSGTIYYWVTGVRLSLTSPWTSTAHTDTLDTKYWLSINGAGESVWTTTVSPGFDKCLVANCIYFTAYKFAIREVHGLMPHTAHKEFHNVVGTYRGSGGSAVTASYEALTNTIAAVTPDVDEAVINDEDLPSTIAAFAAAEGYTQLYFDTNAATFVTGAALPYLVTGTPGSGNPLYNENPITGTALTEITNINRWFNVYTIFVPVTADTESQAYRMLWLTGQKIYTTLSAAQSEDFRTVALGNLQTIFSEFLPYIRWSFIRTNSNLTYSTQVAATPTYLLGTAAQLVSVSGFNPVDHNALTGRSDADSHPASAITGTAVTLAGSEELTNKTMTEQIINNFAAFNHETTPAAAAAGTLRAYAKSDNSLYTIDPNGVEIQVGSGSGQGEKNYITNPSMKSATTGWATSDAAKLTVTRTTTAAELPREYTTGTGIKILSVASADSTDAYISYPFTLDDVDLNKKLKVTWSQKLVGAYAAGNLDVYIAAAASPQTVLHACVTTDIPAVEGVFTTSFDSASTAALALVFKSTGVNMADDVGLVISDVVVGPGSIVTGAVVGPWTTLSSPSITGITVGDGSLSAARRRVGDSYEYDYAFTAGASSSFSGTFSITLPDSDTINGSVIDVAKLGVCGVAWLFDNDAGTQATGSVRINDATSVRFAANSASNSITNTVPWTWATADRLTVRFSLPISSLAGSGTVNLGQNVVEYASVGGTWDADSTTTVYGPGGSLMGGALSAGRVKTITWQTPVQVTDRIQIWASKDGRQWQPINGAKIGSGNTPIVNSVNAAGSMLQGSGVGWYAGATAYTTIVEFSRYVYMSNDDSPTGDWPSSEAYWVATKSSAGAAVGFGAATATSAGLLKSYEEGAEGDLGTITINGGTWSTIDSKKYKWVKVGNRVDFWARIESTTAASGLTSISFSIPAACPTPAKLSTTGTNEWGVPGMGATAEGTGTILSAVQVALFNSDVYVYQASASTKLITLQMTYWV